MLAPSALVGRELAVQHQQVAAHRAAPVTVGHHGVRKQTAGLADPAVVAVEQGQVGLGIVRPAGGGTHIVRHRGRGTVEVRLIEGVGLDHPGRGVVFIKTVLQGILQRVAHLTQVVRGTPLGPNRGHFQDRPDTDPISQQDRLVLGQRLHPGQEVHEGALAPVKTLLRGFRERPLAHHVRAPGCRFRGGHCSPSTLAPPGNSPAASSRAVSGAASGARGRPSR